MNYSAATGPLVPAAPVPLTSEMDKMFSDLGLETFVNKSADNSNSQKDTVTPSQSSNSLEEKHRMARQQEQSQRLQSSADLKPKPVVVGMNTSQGPMKLQQKPMDLTSSLMDSNLNQIKSPTGIKNNWATSGTGNGGSDWGAMTSAPTTGGGGSAAGENWNGNFAGFNSMSSAGTAPMTMTSPTSMGMMSAQPQQWGTATNNNANNNWSALDNLLPAKPQKTAMNQMGNQQPLLMSQSTGNNSNIKSGTNQLSQQDIMEFLG